RISVVQVGSRQKVGTDHFQTVASGSVAAQHQGRGLEGAVNDRNLALVSLLYLNPPYDWEAGARNNQRLECVFLERTYGWLKPTGVLLFVIPQARLAKCARHVTTW
ncbi:MAG: hypothetical protein ACLP6G_04525, partial [Terriglobales bacterium]